MASRANQEKRYTTDDQRWRAVATRDRGAEGMFFYSVRTTGVYCRPGCASRLAKRANVQFHRTSGEAESAGFRACKRCRPNDTRAANPNAEGIECACRLIEASEKLPLLAELAAAAHMSQSHFHRVFKAQLGITPRDYGKAKRVARVQQELAARKSVTQAMHSAGYGSSSQFYGEATRSLGMSPVEYRAGGSGQRIQFAVGKCWLGDILVAATDLGICAILLGDDPEELLRDLEHRFSHAELVGGDKNFDRTVARVVGFLEKPARGLELPLDIRGTAFQQRVWAALQRIPLGRTATYTEIAHLLGMPRSVRAVAQACAANPLAVAIPCHRVVRRDSGLAGYRWGIDRKQALLAQESQAVEYADMPRLSDDKSFVRSRLKREAD